jgi:6-pyruvoyltetrahydropterin/6-carboxytetrahydropterin synthase
MRCQLSREFRFEAAHQLPKVPETHKCYRMHGHGYLITVVVEGEVDDDLGWLMDFAAIDGVVNPVIAELDHRVLNDLPGLANPTSEILAAWMWQRVAPGLPLMVELVVSETPSSRCTYRGE